MSSVDGDSGPHIVGEPRLRKSQVTWLGIRMALFVLLESLGDLWCFLCGGAGAVCDMR